MNLVLNLWPFLPQIARTYQDKLPYQYTTLYYFKKLNFSGTIATMSFLFHEKTKKTMKWVWGTFALIIILSMIFAYSGGAGLF